MAYSSMLQSFRPIGLYTVFNLASVRASSSKRMRPLAMPSLRLRRSCASFSFLRVASCFGESVSLQANWLSSFSKNWRWPGFNKFGSMRSKQMRANVSSVGVRVGRVFKNGSFLQVC